MVVAALDGARYSSLAAVEMLMEKPRSSLDSAAMVADALALLNPAPEVPAEESRLLSLLALVLESMVDSTETLQARLQTHEGGAAPQLTVFHGLRAPPISIEAYLVRIAKYAKCSPACFAHAMVHMLKLAQQDASFAPTRLNVHRLLLTGVLISAKFLDDRYFNNAFYAKVGGVSTAELNRLELEMLQLLEFKLSVTPEQLVTVLLDAQSGRLVAQMATAYSTCCGLALSGLASMAGGSGLFSSGSGMAPGLAQAGAAVALAGMLGSQCGMQFHCWDGSSSAMRGQHILQQHQQVQQYTGVQRKRRSNSLELMDSCDCRPKLYHRASMEVVAMAQ
eukprot:gene10536-10696_t